VNRILACAERLLSHNCWSWLRFGAVEQWFSTFSLKEAKPRSSILLERKVALKNFKHKTIDTETNRGVIERLLRVAQRCSRAAVENHWAKSAFH